METAKLVLILAVTVISAAGVWRLTPYRSRGATIALDQGAVVDRTVLRQEVSQSRTRLRTQHATR